MSKYLSQQEFHAIIGQIVMDNSFVLMSQDTYNETEVAKAIKLTGRVDELLYASINMSCVGYGNKKYGNYKLKDKIHDIANILNMCHVKLGLGKDAKLLEGDLTPQRLCRAFRNEIREYLAATNFETYLFRKYSTQNKVYLSIMFRGAEYLDGLSKEECDYLLETYTAMDRHTGLHISDRILRVFQAKGYLKRAVV